MDEATTEENPTTIEEGGRLIQVLKEEMSKRRAALARASVASTGTRQAASEFELAVLDECLMTL